MRWVGGHTAAAAAAIQGWRGSGAGEVRMRHACAVPLPLRGYLRRAACATHHTWPRISSLTPLLYSPTVCLVWTCWCCRTLRVVCHGLVARTSDVMSNTTTTKLMYTTGHTSTVTAICATVLMAIVAGGNHDGVRRTS